MADSASFLDLADAAARQRGLVTGAQAARLGLSGEAVAELVATGLLQPVLRDAFRTAGTHATPAWTHAYACWLLLDERAFAWERPKGAEGPVASHETACAALAIGGPSATAAVFTVPRGREAPQGVRLHPARLAETEVTWVDGLPVTTARRTVADLVRDWNDVDHVRRAVAGALRKDLVDLRELYADLAPLADEYGLPADAPTFADHLTGRLPVDALSPRNRAAYAALRHPDRVRRVRAALGEALRAGGVAEGGPGGGAAADEIAAGIVAAADSHG